MATNPAETKVSLRRALQRAGDPRCTPSGVLRPSVSVNSETPAAAPAAAPPASARASDIREMLDTAYLSVGLPVGPDGLTRNTVLDYSATPGAATAAAHPASVCASDNWDMSETARLSAGSPAGPNRLTRDMVIGCSVTSAPAHTAAPLALTPASDHGYTSHAAARDAGARHDPQGPRHPSRRSTGAAIPTVLSVVGAGATAILEPRLALRAFGPCPRSSTAHTAPAPPDTRRGSAGCPCNPRGLAARASTTGRSYDRRLGDSGPALHARAHPVDPTTPRATSAAPTRGAWQAPRPPPAAPVTRRAMTFLSTPPAFWQALGSRSAPSQAPSRHPSDLATRASRLGRSYDPLSRFGGPNQHPRRLAHTAMTPSRVCDAQNDDLSFNPACFFAGIRLSICSPTGHLSASRVAARVYWLPLQPARPGSPRVTHRSILRPSPRRLRARAPRVCPPGRSYDPHPRRLAGAATPTSRASDAQSDDLSFNPARLLAGIRLALCSPTGPMSAFPRRLAGGPKHHGCPRNPRLKPRVIAPQPSWLAAPRCIARQAPQRPSRCATPQKTQPPSAALTAAPVDTAAALEAASAGPVAGGQL